MLCVRAFVFSPACVHACVFACVCVCALARARIHVFTGVRLRVCSLCKR